MSASFTSGHRQTLLETVVLVRYLARSRILKYQLFALIIGHGKVFKGGSASPKSFAYIIKAKPICRLLLRHDVVRAFAFALPNTGNSIAARMAIIAMTT